MTGVDAKAPRVQETLLLVEDEPAIRDLMIRRLEKKGYSVLRAQNGQEALKVAANHPTQIDLLITDIVMPLMDGFALEKRLTTMLPPLKVLFLTGYADRAPAVRGGMVELGWPCLLKPFMPEELEAAIRKSLDSSPRKAAAQDKVVAGEDLRIEPRPSWRR